MTYDVAVRNDQDSGFTATVMGWPSCVARGSTREEALKKVREDLSNRLSEVEIVPVEVDAPQPSNPMLKFAGVFKDDPLFDRVLEEIEAYRREIDADDQVP